MKTDTKPTAAQVAQASQQIEWAREDLRDALNDEIARSVAVAMGLRADITQPAPAWIAELANNA
jgi:hypothetical protein